MPNPDLWFFACHFKGDPVMPGCLGLDALWQLTGFFLGWLGGAGPRPGAGRAARSSSPAWSCRPSRRSQYMVDLKRVILRKLMLGIADGVMKADGQVIYAATDLRVGLFETASSLQRSEAAPGRSRAAARARGEARRGLR